MDERQKQQAAMQAGMSVSELEKVLRDNPELAEKLSMSFGASLMPEMDVPRGQSVGPYGAYVASSPISRLASGAVTGAKVGAQMGGQSALLDALRGAKNPDNLPLASGPGGPQMGDNDDDYSMPSGYGGEDEMSAPLTTVPPKPQVAPPPPPGSPTPGTMPQGAGPVAPPGQPMAPPPAQPPMGAIPGPGSIPQQRPPQPGMPPKMPGESEMQYRQRLRAMNVDTGIAP